MEYSIIAFSDHSLEYSRGGRLSPRIMGLQRVELLNIEIFYPRAALVIITLLFQVAVIIPKKKKFVAVIGKVYYIPNSCNNFQHLQTTCSGTIY